MAEQIHKTCSGLFRATGVPLTGTATQGNPYLFLPVPIGRWGRTGFATHWNCNEAIALHDTFLARGGRVRLYDSDSNIAFCFGSDELVSLAHRLSKSVGMPNLECPKDNIIFVCTHGKRDRCCALWGQQVVNKLHSLAAADTWSVYRCSHLGGDRFAATAITFPSGNMYGSLSDETIEAILAAEYGGKIASRWYRGCVFEPKEVQLARFALAQYEICSTSEAPVTIASREETNNELVLSVSYPPNCRARLVFVREQNEMAADCRSLESGMFKPFPTWKLISVNVQAPKSSSGSSGEPTSFG